MECIDGRDLAALCTASRVMWHHIGSDEGIWRKMVLKHIRQHRVPVRLQLLPQWDANGSSSFSKNTTRENEARTGTTYTTSAERRGEGCARANYWRTDLMRRFRASCSLCSTCGRTLSDARTVRPPAFMVLCVYVCIYDLYVYMQCACVWYVCMYVDAIWERVSDRAIACMCTPCGAIVLSLF